MNETVPFELNISQALEVFLNHIEKNYSAPWVVKEKEKHPLNNSVRTERIVEAHSHGYHEICIAVFGKLRLKLKDGFLPLSSCKAGLIPAEVWHQELPIEDESYLAIWIAFQQKRITIHLSGMDRDRGFHTIEGMRITNSSDYFNLLFQDILHEIENSSYRGDDLIKTTVIKMVIVLSRIIQGKGPEEDWKSKIVTETFNLLENRKDQHLTMAELSGEIGICPHYLNGIFKSSTGKTVSQSFKEIKLDEAKRLLKETDEPIKYISKSLGFYDQYHFSKFFKKETGDAPSLYRENTKVTSTS
jgi:AraC-like DNA-binding protein